MDNRDRVRQLASEGKTTKEIAEITGLAICTVGQYRVGANNLEMEPKNITCKMTTEQQKEWTAAVNRLRKAAGKEPLRVGG